MMDSDLVVRYSMIEPGYKEVFILMDVFLAATLFDSNEDFVGEIVSERFFMLRHKFCKGDYGEEKQVAED